jgi:DNA polymerase elongation subunit (family B)
VGRKAFAGEAEEATKQEKEQMRILLLDIETAPNKAFVWGMFKQNISPSQVIASSYILCWTAKWFGEKKVYFHSVQEGKPKLMLGGIHRLLDEADAVVHYNGQKFDIPTLNKEFMKHGFTPPSPYHQIDLLLVAKKMYRFDSNRLDSVSRYLGIGEKVRHEGFELWIKCMDGEKDAWKKMEKYNRHDVVLLERLYKKMIPWISNHPNHGAHEDHLCCPNCGGEKYSQQGYRVTKILKYIRYKCEQCGTWFRGNKSVSVRRQERFVGIPQ